MKVVSRWLVAFGMAAGLCGWLWLRRPDHLVQADDIIGFPAFWNFDFQPLFLRHRLLVWLLALTTAVVYVLLRRWGPLAEVTESEPEGPSRADRRPTPETADPPPSASRPGTWGLRLRVLPPAALLVVAASSLGTSLTQEVSVGGLAVGFAYVALVAATTRVLSGRQVRFQTLARVNAVGAGVASVVAVYLFSRGTATIDAAGMVRRWAWLPLWIAVLAVIVVTIVVLRMMAHRPPSEVERKVVTVVVGAAGVFLLTARLPGGVGTINGFDGSHSVVGADLLTRGYFPWRDYLAMHGLFDDALRTSVGFALFEHSYWGEHAALLLLWTPLFMIGLYLLLVWATPRAWMVHVVAVFASPLVLTVLPVAHRWVGMGYVLVLLGVALQRRTTASVVALTCTLFVFAVLVPEQSFQVVGVAAALVAADLVGRDSDTSLLSRLRLTRVFVATGTVLLAALLGFLALHGAVRDWIDYYVVFGPGHNESGALPPDQTDAGHWRTIFFANEWITGLTIAALCAWVIARRPVTARGGVLAAAAVTVGLYAEKALGRFDAPHVMQVMSVALPLWMLLVVLIGVSFNAWAGEWFEDRRLLLGTRVIAVGSLLTLFAGVLLPQNGGVDGVLRRVGSAAENNKVAIASQSDRAPLIGYQGSPATDLTMVSDLRILLDRLTPAGELVYDFTNSAGYFTYLLQEDLATRFYTVGVALAEDAQDEVVEDLEANPPAVVVFDSVSYGLTSWDGPRNEVRHFEISQYLLDGWTPVASTYGFLFLMRNDLLDSMPELPTLHQPVLTTDLYDSMPGCDWGYAAHFLRSDAEGRRVDLSVTPGHAFALQVVGWAYDSAADRPADKVLVAEGGKVVGEVGVNAERPDIAASLGQPGAARSGFASSMVIPDESDTPPLAAYALFADGRARVLSPPPGFQGPRVLRRSDGSRVRVAPVKDVAPGILEAMQGEPIDMLTADLPAGIDLSSFALASFRADGPIGVTYVRVVDRLGDTGPGSVNRPIAFGTPANQGDEVNVRVGACLSWHDFGGDRLYFTQQGGRPITAVELSGVADE